ncbi:lysine-specific demethylase 4A isoform X1 [Paralichthys olivaceus]|uniref:lysine-specific demethylase 4A isoform X1 n=1 Tax=Paralichthys olivaceus TaxID=8255 RepID=UPI00097D27E3|nr:PREDICTED: lysine-specific demethylase 4A-like isoform X2 [Paralichthys olivaceus]XP_019965317.1 PREDICTED: lysine-specific demethylase 4A-like isoform X2 [Paralichthys olivaceus]
MFVMASDAVSQNHGSKGIMTFYPTAEQFKNFSRYIAYMESQGAHKAGLAKIVPPKEWKPRQSYDNIDDLVIPAPIQQVVTGQSGLFTQYNIQKKSMTVREFRKIANSDKFCSPHYDDFEELERKYWKNVTFNPPIYGADVNGSLYDPDVKEWNICHLDTILDTVEHESGITIEGVNTPYLYFGMWKTTFAWHTEDMDLYSINYLHFGEPKSWYCVPPEHGKRLERLAQGFFPGSAQNCEAFLRHKMTLLSPSILKKYGIPFEKITQEAGEFMVTFPYAYHAGFNHGFNCAESTNFATERWIEYGKQAVLCSCRKDMVKISMDVFVKKFQPDRYEQWLAGRNVVPIDHSRPTPEAKEFLGDSYSDNPSNSCSVENCGEDGERKSMTQRIETKRHRVCLEVPKEVAPKDEDEEDEEQYGKRPRLSLIPPRTIPQDGRRNKGPPKLVVTPTKLTLMDPFHRALTQSNSNGGRPPHYTKTRAPAISAQSHTRNGHLSLSASPEWREASAQPARKMGVASLLFHRTLSPKDTLQVHSYTLEKHRQPQTQLQVHSYAREHQPRHLQHKSYTQVQSSFQDLSCETADQQQESKFIIIKMAQTESEVQSPEKQDQKEDKPKMSTSIEAQPEVEEPEVEPESTSPQVQPQQQELSYMGKKAPKNNKRKNNQSPLADSGITILRDTIPLQKPDYKETKVVAQNYHLLLQQVSEEQSYCKSVAKKQQQQEELRKLPRHHPLIREVHSDDDMCEDVEFEQEEKEEWAKPLTQLWQCRPHNHEAEREYNKSMGQLAPYCSICLIFHTHHQSESSSGSSSITLVNRPGGCQWSKPLIPEMCFNTQTGKTNESEEGQLSNPHMGEDGTSRLVSCAQCCVRVHTSCYGVSCDEAELDDWLCARCEADAITEDCCLCSLRGGALQRANNDKWVHVLCAITVLEACFVNITERSPIDLSAIPLPRFRLKCVYCRKRIKREVMGCCVQCSHGRCSTAFHPTCAQAAGVLMHPDDWPFVVYITCHRHRTPVIPERNKASMRELAVGQKVICKYRNGRYYHSDVVELTTASFYEVVFDDGSYSDNLFPEDIENRDCVRLGPPDEGDAVQVRWTDGLIYGAKFVASHSIPMYLVEFEDGSQISVKREDIYSLDEDLPKRVKSRMSVASDMRFELFSQSNVKQNSKRQRVINSRYRGDYVEPVIYRAIME